MDYEYVKNYYMVPACYGRKVIVGGKSGIIIEDMGNYIGVNFDSDKPGVALPCHPTSEVQYLDMGQPRKMSRSAKRYQDFLRVADCFDSFAQYLRYLENERLKEK